MVEFAESAADEKLFVMKDSAVEGTPFSDKEVVIKIKRGGYYVVRDKFTEDITDGGK